MFSRLLIGAFLAVLTEGARAQKSPSPAPSALDRPSSPLQKYFKEEVRSIEADAAAALANPAEWILQAPARRRELREMLGLEPMPGRGPLKPVVTKTLEHPEFSVEALHFQSSPGLYVTGNLYIPKRREGRLPAVLYVCGHSRMVEGGKSFGNKTGYQHHPEWFARNGFVCLAIDTIQLGEIPGLHHGTHNLGLWWWNSRGYTPAGVETWNGIRALDYLESRPEVDGTRLGVTGRSGGGAYSWYIAALDERIKAAVPVAGITDLQNHLDDGVVDGHCDCMFALNTKRWDFSMLAALVAPRALLITNTDKDPIFPLDGVQRVHRAAAGVYKGANAADKLGLLISEGPHKDFQELQIGAFRWFKRFLANDPDYAAQPSEKLFKPSELRVFDELPPQEQTSKTHHWFVPKANSNTFPAAAAGWKTTAPEWIAKIRSTSFANSSLGGSAPRIRLLAKKVSGTESIAHFSLTPAEAGSGLVETALLARGASRSVDKFIEQVSASTKGNEASAAQTTLQVVDDLEITRELASFHNGTGPKADALELLFSPRGFTSCSEQGVVPDPWAATTKELTRIKRRYMLTGQTLDAARVGDIVRCASALRSAGCAPISMKAVGSQSTNTLYASLFCDGIQELELKGLPASHEAPEAPDYFRILTVLDITQAIELARTRSKVTSAP